MFKTRKLLKIHPRPLEHAHGQVFQLLNVNTLGELGNPKYWDFQPKSIHLSRFDQSKR